MCRCSTGALQPALAAGGYRVDDAVTDAGDIVGGRLQYRPKLRQTRTATRDAAVVQAAVALTADTSAHAMATLQAHAVAVQPLPYGNVGAPWGRRGRTTYSASPCAMPRRSPALQPPARVSWCLVPLGMLARRARPARTCVRHSGLVLPLTPDQASAGGSKVTSLPA